MRKHTIGHVPCRINGDWYHIYALIVAEQGPDNGLRESPGFPQNKEAMNIGGSVV